MTDPNLADVKSELAALGQAVQVDASIRGLERPTTPTMPVVCLERVREGEQPDYCTHGYAQCVSCLRWCWLGDETGKIVGAGEALPLCLECAKANIPPGSAPTQHLEDHRRDAGPH